MTTWAKYSDTLRFLLMSWGIDEYMWYKGMNSTDSDESLHGIELLAVAGRVEELADVLEVRCIE